MKFLVMEASPHAGEILNLKPIISTPSSTFSKSRFGSQRKITKWLLDTKYWALSIRPKLQGFIRKWSINNVFIIFFLSHLSFWKIIQPISRVRLATWLLNTGWPVGDILYTFSFQNFFSTHQGNQIGHSLESWS